MYFVAVRDRAANESEAVEEICAPPSEAFDIKNLAVPSQLETEPLRCAVFVKSPLHGRVAKLLLFSLLARRRDQ